MSDSVVAIVSAFFIIGITVGVIAVIALSVLRAERRRGPGDHDAPDDPLGYGPGDHPRWPGDDDTDFSGR